jgi:hypothetical protein
MKLITPQQPLCAGRQLCADLLQVFVVCLVLALPFRARSLSDRVIQGSETGEQVSSGIS